MHLGRFKYVQISVTMHSKHAMYRHHTYIHSKLYAVYISLLNESREMMVLKMVAKDWGWCWFDVTLKELSGWLGKVGEGEGGWCHGCILMWKDLPQESSTCSNKSIIYSSSSILSMNTNVNNWSMLLHNDIFTCNMFSVTVNSVFLCRN